MNKTILIIVIVLVAGIGGYFLLMGGYQAPAPAPTQTLPTTQTSATQVTEISVSGTEFSFSPANLTVTAGEKVKLTFKNNGGASHNFVIQSLGVSTRTISPGQTDTIEFTVPASGTYTFTCSVPGHAIAGMLGDLLVE